MSRNTPKKLTPKQNKAITVLASGGSIEDARKAANVSNTTVDIWLKKPEFKKGLEEATQEYRHQYWKAEAENIRDLNSRIGKSFSSLFEISIAKFQDWAEGVELESLSDSNKIRYLTELRGCAEAGIAYLDKAWAIDKALGLLEEKNKE